jgi:hypothetical protein
MAETKTCDICGKEIGGDDKHYVLWHRDREINGHYPCFAETVAMWIDAGKMADETCSVETPERRRMRLFQKIRLGVRAITSATQELERIVSLLADAAE